MVELAAADIIADTLKFLHADHDLLANPVIQTP